MIANTDIPYTVWRVVPYTVRTRTGMMVMMTMMMRRRRRRRRGTY
jgi:hypothetical protein